MFIFKASKIINNTEISVYIMGTIHVGTHKTADDVTSALRILEPGVVAVELAMPSSNFSAATSTAVASAIMASTGLSTSNGCEAAIARYVEETETAYLSIENEDIQRKAVAEMQIPVEIPAGFVEATTMLVNACECGDLDTCVKMINSDSSDSATSSHYQMVRNMGMAQKAMELLLDRRSNPLVAVGFTHLVGVGNVLDILSALGVRVTRVC